MSMDADTKMGILGISIAASIGFILIGVCCIEVDESHYVRYTRPSIGQTTSDCSKLFNTDASRSYTEIDEEGNIVETRTYTFGQLRVHLTFVEGRLVHIKEEK